MPVAWDDSLDSPIGFDAVQSFVGGQNSNTRPRFLNPDQSALLQDAEVSVSGQISSRFGSEVIGNVISGGKRIDALGFYNTTALTAPIAIANSHVYYLDGDTWTDFSSVTVSDYPSIVQGIDKLYWAAGNNLRVWDGTTASSVSGDGDTAGPVDVSIVLWHTNRLVVAGPFIKGKTTDPGPIPDAIYFSNILDPGTWGTNKNLQQLRVGAGDGLEIISLVPWNGFTIAVFKRRSVWVVNADPSLGDVSNFPIQLVHGNVGCVARRSAVQVGSDILFLADDGVRSLQQVIGSDTQHELSVPLSYPVQDIINRINWSAAGQAAATFWRNLYMLALPLDGSLLNNYILVFNTVTKSWQGLWTNLPVYCFGTREIDNVARLLMGLDNSSPGRVIEYFDYVSPQDWTDGTFTDFNGTAVSPRLLTRSLTFGDPLAEKLGIGAEVEWNNSKGSILVTPIIDEVAQSKITIDIPPNGFDVPFTFPLTIGQAGTGREQFDLMQYGPFRELQFDIQGFGDGRKELRQIAVAGITRPTVIGNS